ncbi:MAG TPA: hypothetical protein VF556_13085 [Pyrinomonadaceae bacterium]|jgi:hypothetical protein
MNKTKYLFLIVLCAALIGGTILKVSAQTGGDKILVAGKSPLRQSEMNKIIEFYEWALEAKFTGEQRERFQKLQTEAYRSDVAGSRKGADELLGVFAKALEKDEATQRRMREFLSVELVKEFHRVNDETSQLLISIYEQARGNQSDVSADNEAPEAVSNDKNVSNANDNTSGSVGNISNFVGEWVWGRSGSSTYATGGSYMGSNGSRHTYKFSANGAVEYTGIMNVMTGGCNMQVFKTAKGKAGISGDTLTIDWQPASFSRDDSCSPSKNYKKTLPAETETFKVRFKNDYGQTQLCMTGKDETCFSKTGK